MCQSIASMPEVKTLDVTFVGAHALGRSKCPAGLRWKDWSVTEARKNSALVNNNS